MEKPTNIYPAVVFDLHPKVKAFLDSLNDQGQVDLDDQGHPYVVKVERQGPNIVTQIIRNNQLESFVLNPRKKSDPLISWDQNDGYVRQGGKRTIDMGQDTKNSRKERPKRVSFESISNIVESIIGDKS